MLKNKSRRIHRRYKKICPRCRNRLMKPCGAIRLGPRGGLRKVYRCEKCLYQSIG